MNPKGFLVYKCRMCGAQFDGIHVPEFHFAAILLTAGNKFPPDWGAARKEYLLDVHFCGGNDSIGVADLIGGRRSDEP